MHDVLTFPDRGGTGWRTKAATWGEVDPTNLHFAASAYWSKRGPVAPREVLADLGLERTPELLLLIAILTSLPPRQYDKAWRTVATVLSAAPGLDAIAAFQIIDASAPSRNKGLRP